ncbi:unnamed protein product [Ceratitis capitata]|uniref:(Mediterranean fruit fly) hypothetical protein n=1 Tax=Ceratitis capitata TaxID=7213 RepID=A0A811UNC8_CERCA|nr:unnamed protein product [Ceratitis capitata]
MQFAANHPPAAAACTYIQPAIVPLIVYQAVVVFITFIVLQHRQQQQECIIPTYVINPLAPFVQPTNQSGRKVNPFAFDDLFLKEDTDIGARLDAQVNGERGRSSLWCVLADCWLKLVHHLSMVWVV